MIMIWGESNSWLYVKWNGFTCINSPCIISEKMNPSLDSYCLVLFHNIKTFFNYFLNFIMTKIYRIIQWFYDYDMYKLDCTFVE